MYSTAHSLPMVEVCFDVSSPVSCVMPRACLCLRHRQGHPHAQVDKKPSLPKQWKLERMEGINETVHEGRVNGCTDRRPPASSPPTCPRPCLPRTQSQARGPSHCDSFRPVDPIGVSESHAALGNARAPFSPKHEGAVPRVPRGSAGPPWRVLFSARRTRRTWRRRSCPR